jgi:hypothetical protein
MRVAAAEEPKNLKDRHHVDISECITLPYAYRQLE